MRKALRCAGARRRHHPKAAGELQSASRTISSGTGRVLHDDYGQGPCKPVDTAKPRPPVGDASQLQIPAGLVPTNFELSMVRKRIRWPVPVNAKRLESSYRFFID